VIAFITALIVPDDRALPPFEIEMVAEHPAIVARHLNAYSSDHEGHWSAHAVRYEDGSRFFNRRALQEAHR
jgi:hypothetical protein